MGEALRHVVAIAGIVLSGCASGPSLDHVAPSQVLAGDSVHVWGHLIDSSALVELVNAEGRVIIARDVASRDGSHVAVGIPSITPPGEWSVRVVVGEQTLVLDRALTIVDESSIAVCGAGFVANTRVALVPQSIRIERFSDMDNGEIIDVPISDVRHVELDIPETDVPCSVIWLRLMDGRRVAFDQSRTKPMRVRAALLAREIERPFIPLQAAVVDPAADAE